MGNYPVEQGCGPPDHPARGSEAQLETDWTDSKLPRRLHSPETHAFCMLIS